MGVFNIFSKKVVDSLPTLDPSALIEFLDSDNTLIDCSTVAGRTKAYTDCDIVQSVISRRAEAISNLKVWILDESTGKEVVTPQAKSKIDKLNNMNPDQDFRMFFSELDTYRALHGIAYVRKVKSQVLSSETNYYVIPNERINIEYDGTTQDYKGNRKVKRYLILGDTNTTYVEPKDMLVIKDGILGFDQDREEGASRLRALSEVVSTIIILWEIRANLIGDAGVQNIISLQGKDNATLVSPFLQSEKDDLYKQLKKFGLRRGQNKNILTKTSANVANLSAKIVDMDLSNTLKDAIKSVANAYSTPPMLIGVEDSRFKTLTEANRMYYTIGIIPSTNYLLSVFAKELGIDKKMGLLSCDYSHLDFYQEGKKDEAVAFQQMSNAVIPLYEKGLITKEEALIKLDLK